MHARFNEFNPGIYIEPFDEYIVWSEYFRSKLLTLNSNYIPNNISILPPHFNSLGYHFPSNKLSLTTVLWVGESFMNLDDILPYIKSIDRNLYRVIFRPKGPLSSYLNKFLLDHNIEVCRSSSVHQSISIYRPQVFIGTYSTCLIESLAYGIRSVVLSIPYDYGKHLWQDSICLLCPSSSEINETIATASMSFQKISADEIKFLLVFPYHNLCLKNFFSP